MTPISEEPCLWYNLSMEGKSEDFEHRSEASASSKSEDTKSEADTRTKNKKRRIIIAIIIALGVICPIILGIIGFWNFLLFSFVGQGVTTGHGTKLASDEQMAFFASQKYGKASVRGSETNEDNTKTTFYMVDDGCGFEYICSSLEQRFCIDATCSDRYYEQKSCDFDAKYRDYVRNKIDDDERIEVDRGQGKFHFMYFSFNSAEEALSKGPEKTKKIKQYDVKNRLDNDTIGLYIGDSYYGECRVGGGCEDKYEAEVDQELYSALRVFGCKPTVTNGNCTEEDVVYRYYELRPYKEIEGLQLDWIVNKKEGISEDDLAVLYYYDFRGKTYFVTGVEVDIPGGTPLYNPDRQYAIRTHFSDYLIEKNRD